MEAIIACRKDLISNQQSGMLVEHIQRTAVLSLEQHASSERLNKLLLSLPVFQTPSTSFLDEVFFKPVIGPMSVESVIFTI